MWARLRRLPRRPGAEDRGAGGDEEGAGEEEHEQQAAGDAGAASSGEIVRRNGRRGVDVASQWALACELASSLAGVWAWASWSLRCHTSPPRGEPLPAALECESEARLLAVSLPARLPAESPCESVEWLPAESPYSSPQAQTEAEAAARRTACVLASR